MRLWISSLISLGLVAGCAWPRTAPASSLPELVMLTGVATLPAEYVSTGPARPVLANLDGQVVAVGSLTGEHGEFAVAIPATSLPERPALCQVLLRDPDRHPILRGMLRLARSGPEAPLVLDGTSTTVALAALATLQQGGHPERWNLSRLQQHPELVSLGARYARQLGAWSSQASAQVLPPAPDASALQRVQALAEPAP